MSPTLVVAYPSLIPGRRRTGSKPQRKGSCPKFIPKPSGSCRSHIAALRHCSGLCLWEQHSIDYGVHIDSPAKDRGEPEYTVPCHGWPETTAGALKDQFPDKA